MNGFQNMETERTKSLSTSLSSALMVSMVVSAWAASFSAATSAILSLGFEMDPYISVYPAVAARPTATKPILLLQ